MSVTVVFTAVSVWVSETGGLCSKSIHIKYKTQKQTMSFSTHWTLSDVQLIFFTALASYAYQNLCQIHVVRLHFEWPWSSGEGWDSVEDLGSNEGYDKVRFRIWLTWSLLWKGISGVLWEYLCIPPVLLTVRPSSMRVCAVSLKSLLVVCWMCVKWFAIVCIFLLYCQWKFVMFP